MDEKKKAPSDQKQSDQEILDSLARASIIDLANSIHSEWRPYLNTEGEMLLGHEVSFDRAVLIQVQKALATRNETYEQGMKLLHEQNRKIVKLTEENKHLKEQYTVLCNKRNEDFHTLTVIGEKQRDFIESANKKLRKLGL